jgi:hypothetical protein
VFIHQNSVSLSHKFAELKYANSAPSVQRFFKVINKTTLYAKEQYLAKYDERKLASDFQITGI